MLKWGNRIDSLIEDLRADLPDLQVDIRPVTTEQPVRIIALRRSSEPLDVVELIEDREELLVLFGVNLRRRDTHPPTYKAIPGCNSEAPHRIRGAGYVKIQLLPPHAKNLGPRHLQHLKPDRALSSLPWWR